MRLASFLACAAALCAAPVSLRASIVNGDFATGDLTGWETYDPLDFLPMTVLPGVVESDGGGGFQARMTATQPPAKAPAQFGTLVFHATSIFQSFTLAEPATLAIDWEATLESLPGSSSEPGSAFALAQLSDVGGFVGLPVKFTTDDFFDIGGIQIQSPLSTALFKLPAGTYKLELFSGTDSVPADGEASASAELVVHNVYLLPIPEPATWLLLALAVPALACAAARRRR